MAVTYASGLKDTRMTDVVTAIGSAGKLEIGTTAMASILATITLGSPAGTVSGGVLTFDMPKSDASADNTGTAAAARIRTSGDVDVITGLTVGTGTENIVLNSTSITAGQTVTINSGSITHG